MARRKTARIDDTQRTLEVRSASATVGTMTAHVPHLLMLANRRQYTQARAYDFRIKAGLIDSNAEVIYEVFTLSNAWWVKRSIEMAKGVWLESTKEERALLGKNAATYNDFIISATTGAAGNFANLHSYIPASSGDDMTQSEVTADETLYEGTLVSDLSDDAGDTMGFTVLGEDVTGPGVFNIFDQYLLSRRITPDTDSRAGPYADLLEIDEDAMASLQQDGDLTPWDADAFPSPFVLQDVISIDQALPGGGQSIWSKTMTAPLGIVIVKARSNAGAEVNFTGNEKFLLEVKKGTYKGVHAPAYKALNGVLGK